MDRLEIDKALEDADLVIDATASISACRNIADHKTSARRVSVFFNPAGNSVVLLVEPSDRTLGLRDLEVEYLRLVSQKKELSEHLADPSGTYFYTGGCQAITNHIPQSRVMALSGLVSAGLGDAIDHDRGVVSVWMMEEDGSVKLHEVDPYPVTMFRMQDWTIKVDKNLEQRMQKMRDDCLPDETGGVLTGVVDVSAKQIHLLDAMPAPKNSISSPEGFQRGTAGVEEYLEKIKTVTKGQACYVGEWHSHPPFTSTTPSAVDLDQIDWLAKLLDIDHLPGLMLIVGEQDIRIFLANQEAILEQGTMVTRVNVDKIKFDR